MRLCVLAIVALLCHLTITPAARPPRYTDMPPEWQGVFPVAAHRWPMNGDLRDWRARQREWLKQQRARTDWQGPLPSRMWVDHQGDCRWDDIPKHWPIGMRYWNAPPEQCFPLIGMVFCPNVTQSGDLHGRDGGFWCERCEWWHGGACP